ncbi:DUF1592 domain-containing protein [Agaribacterium haliotis]|uniref:DUF1592 domain-containing protein n=1 Tax=Agaribacterium haliotis TaxID=2013869 RepID=UPI001177CB93|nr:DUF1592 domain-containing protein [Agaribacterium haliotis]
MTSRIWLLACAFLVLSACGGSGTPTDSPLPGSSAPSPTTNPVASPSASLEPSPTESLRPEPTQTPAAGTSIPPAPQPSPGQPSTAPSPLPNQSPNVPVATPTPVVSLPPVVQPSPAPSPLPSSAPSSIPSPQPSAEPSVEPSTQPSAQPSTVPSPQLSPSPLPSTAPEPSPMPSQPASDIEVGAGLYLAELGGGASCASCHGENGEGVQNRGGEILHCGPNCDSLSALESKISLSMPIGNASACSGECATKVAAYIWSELMGKALDDELACDAGIQKVSPMRRLNKSELINAIDDSFGLGGDQFADRLPEETEVIGGFATVGSALTTSRDWTETYIDAAIDAADSIVSMGAFASECSAGSSEPPGFDPSGDQCNTTAECRAVFGDAADDCANSASNQSICMCAGQACAETKPVSDNNCVESALADAASKLYRRGLSDDELARLQSLYSSAGEHELGLQQSLVAMLSSPNFLFAVPADDKSTQRKLSEKELAERLSMALWGSVPDAELLQKVDNKQLYSSLDSEIERMISDAKFDRFSNLFASPWIGLGGYQIEGSDLGISDSEWQQLLSDMQTETKLFVAHIIKNNRPIDEFFTANYSFLNERLARHYDISAGLSGDSFVRSTLPPESHRRGLMTHASVLAKAFDGNKTSVVKRGVIPLEAFSCNAPESPADPSILDAVDEQASSSSSEKEKMAERADPGKACAGCHAVIDPVGWVFTEFGVAGEKVNSDPDGDALDTAGELYGHHFGNAYEMADVMAGQGDFESCFANKFLIHALGRRVDLHSSEDNCAIEAALDSARVNGSVGARDFLKAVLRSDISTISGTIVE